MMDLRFRGRVWKYGDDVNTDEIFAGKYTYTVLDELELARHALEDLDPRFASNVAIGDIIVAGRNWGTGSSREQAVTALKQAGIRAIVATSFARIYYRNAINAGLPVISCPEAVVEIQDGDTVEIDIVGRTIHTERGRYSFPPFSPSVLQMLQAGGLIPMLRERLRTGFDG